LILLAIFPDGRYFMSVTSTMTESLRMVRNQEVFCFFFFKKEDFLLFLIPTDFISLRSQFSARPAQTCRCGAACSTFANT